ncbi:MAG: trigger factor [Halanaerobiales bacterium]
MDVKKEQKENNKVELKVEIEPERVNTALEQAYKKVVKDVELPGFRKGKVPRKVLEAKYGKEVLHKDALDILIPEGYSEAVEETEIEPIDQPDIEDFYIAEDEPATFTATVEVKPEVKLGQYTDLGIEKEEVEVTEEEVEERIEHTREHHGQLVSVDREEVQEGDHVIIDFEGKIDGEAFEGGSAEEYSLEIGSNTFIPGFEEQLIGARVGEEKEVDVTFPEDYNAEDLAGEDAVFTVNIKEIKEKQLPELDDEFASEASEHDSLEEWKEEIRESIKEQKEEETERKYENEILETIAESTEVEIPEKLVDNELDKMYQNLSYNISAQGMEIDDYLNYMGMEEEGWREENRETAEKQAKNNLILEAIAEVEDIEIEEDEIDEQIEEIAEQNDQDKEQVKAIMQMQGQLDGLKESLRIQKAMDFLKENN